MSLNKEPEWSLAPPAAMSDGLLGWLLEKGSLTQKMQALCKCSFEVKVLMHEWGTAHSTEREQLGLTAQERTLVRETQLFADNQMYIYARSIFPERTLGDQGHVFKNLGANSLGEVLFKDPNLVAGQRWYAKFQLEHGDFQKAVVDMETRPSLLWGRRTKYIFHNKPLLVTELFMPVIS